MKPKLCSACLRPLADRDIATSLPWMKRAIYLAVVAAGDLGLTKWEIADKVYASKGPESVAVIKAHVSIMNKVHLRKHGIKISAANRESPGGNGLYRVVAIGEAQGGGQP